MSDDDDKLEKLKATNERLWEQLHHLDTMFVLLHGAIKEIAEATKTLDGGVLEKLEEAAKLRAIHHSWRPSGTE